MLEGLRNLFRKVETRTLELEYQLGQGQDGRHILQVFRRIDSKILPVEDISPLLRYGYHEIISREDGDVISTISDDDRQILLSLQSLNPEILPGGRLEFEIEPPVLRFLRKKAAVKETSESRRIVIRDEPLQPVSRISFDPKKGLKVESGFPTDSNSNLTSLEKVHISRDGRYARIGDTFAPLPELNANARKLLNRPVQWVPVRSIPEFFQRDLVLIRKEFQAVLTDLAGELRVITEPLEPVVRISHDSQGWLNFDVSYDGQGFTLPYGLLAEARRKGERFVQLNPTTWVTIDAKTLNKTERELEDLEPIETEAGFRVPASEFASLEEFIAALGGRAELDKAYRQFLDQLTGFESDPNFRLPEAFEAHLARQAEAERRKNPDRLALVLRPYQRAGIHWLDWLRRNQLHGVLADDMGLGKTLQSLCALRLAYDQTGVQQHSLIVAPKSVLSHWDRELRRIFPFMRTHIYHGPKRKQTVFHSSLPYIVITTYETVAKDTEALARVPFFYLILDEATRIKNPDATRTQAIKALNAAHRLALSGTPVENRPAELWSLFDFLMRGHLGKHGTFVRVFEESIMNGDGHASERLGRRIRPFLLRRKKEQVAADLPEKITITEWVSLTREQRRLYGGLQEVVRRLRTALQQGEQVSYSTSILPVLTKLKQICDHPALVTGNPQPFYGRSEKFDWMMERIDEIVDNGEDVVVFSHFLNMLSLFEAALREKGISYIRIDGSTDNRQALIDAFDAGKARVALLSLMAAGHGINMTAANHVIHTDRWWNPAVEDQATDRVHRIGQKQTVFVYQVLTEGTLEERIDTLLAKKRGMADKIIRAATDGSYRWTKDELLELLRPLDSAESR